jgi:hypothetical protein
LSGTPGTPDWNSGIPGIPGITEFIVLVSNTTAAQQSIEQPCRLCCIAAVAESCAGPLMNHEFLD